MKKKTKQLLALVAVIMLAALYIATFIFALADFPGSGRLFQACLVASIGMPILLWIYIWGYGVLTQKKTMSSFFPAEELPDEAQASEDDQTDNKPSDDSQ